MKKNFTILFQGDSITDVCRNRDEQNKPNSSGGGLGFGYPLLVSARLRADRPEVDFQCFDRGISGNRVVDLYARWKCDCLNMKPDLVSILIGVNDTWHEFNWQNGVEVPRYETIYRMLLQWTKEVLPETKIVLIEPFVLPFGAVAPEWLPEVEQRREIVAKLAKEFGCTLIPFQRILNENLKRAPQEYWLVDGVHPTPAGHQLLADAWIQYTKELLR